MTILDKIVNARKIRLEEKKSKIKENSLQRKFDPPRSFFKKDITLIAECKKGSPSKGVLCEEYYPSEIALQYEQGGADAISVLTEPDFFFGSEEHLKAVKLKTSLPVLRKDFIFDTYQVKESWAIGADAILLIASILSDNRLKELVSLAKEYNLETLLEVHTQDELEKALKVSTTAIGINARNLKDFSIDINASKELCRQIPDSVIAVAESGLKSPQMGAEMYKAGFRGFLVGEYFITAKDREKTVREFVQKLK